MYKRILVPYDGSAPSSAGLREAVNLAIESGATLVVLNVVSELPLLMGSEVYASYGEIAEILLKTGQGLAEQAAAMVRKDGAKCEMQVIDAGAMPVCDVIVDQIAAQRCDLVVMGTHGRRGLKRLTLGSDAEMVVRRSPVPVLLVKSADVTG